jgi:hypothetical protein
VLGLRAEVDLMPRFDRGWWDHFGLKVSARLKLDSSDTEWTQDIDMADPWFDFAVWLDDGQTFDLQTFSQFGRYDATTFQEACVGLAVIDRFSGAETSLGEDCINNEVVAEQITEACVDPCAGGVEPLVEGGVEQSDAEIGAAGGCGGDGCGSGGAGAVWLVAFGWLARRRR